MTAGPTSLYPIVYASKPPALNLDFTNGQALDPRITFSRASLATMYDSTGKLTYAPNNGVLQSETFTNAAWSKTASAATAGAADYLGTATATTLEDSAANSGHSVSTSYAAILGTTYIFSVVMKQGTLQYSQLTFGAGQFSGLGYVNFDLQNGTVSATGGTLAASGITALGGGYYRCYMAAVCTATGTNTAFLSMANAGSMIRVGNYVGTVSSIIIDEAQVEAVTYETSPRTYNATVAAAYAGPRFDYDPVTLNPKGLMIEEARTNLFQRSQELDNAYWSQDHTAVTANSAVAPDGTTTADTISDGTDVGTRHIFYQNGSLTLTAASYTVSCFVKDVDRRYVVLGCDSGATLARVYFDLTLGTITDTSAASGTITALPNGWYRITCTFTAEATVSYPQMGLSDVNNDGGTLSFSMPAYTGTSKTIYSWGWQIELGAFATSYIPTVAASATRALENFTMSGVNFTGWYKQEEGTLVVEGAYMGTAVTNVVTANDATNNERNVIYINGTSVLGRTVDGGAVQSDINSGLTYAAGDTIKAAYAYQLNNCAVAVNGRAAVMDISATMPTATQLNVGAGSAGGSSACGWTKSVRYFDMRLPNERLTRLTS